MVKKSASIGANSTIVCGNKIGKYAFIGAGTVITKDVPDFALIVGNPGRIIAWVNKEGQKIKFDKKGYSSCGKFHLNNDLVIELK